jgi:hypothetical protein
MPPKADNKAQKKEKEIKKLAVDATFGMKNKNKSKAVQTIVKNIAASQKGGYSKLQEEIYKEKKMKEKLEEENKLMVDVFAKVVPKPVVISGGEEVQICQFFKAGLCQKGKKCKFSHNVAQDPMKVEKLDLYTDQRDQMFNKKDTIENWDKEKLAEVVDFNSNKYSAPNRTDKVCKAFLEAVEKKTYGWMWVCPNGFNCIFRHCLPEGYELKNAKKDVINDKEAVDVIAEIDEERDKLQANALTPVTEERFMKWLEGRRARREKERVEKSKEELKKLGIKAKKNVTGRELFEKDKELFADADDAVEEYEREEPVEGAEEENGQEQPKTEGEQINVNTDVFADEEVPDL